MNKHEIPKCEFEIDYASIFFSNKTKKTFEELRMKQLLRTALPRWHLLSRFLGFSKRYSFKKNKTMQQALARIMERWRSSTH